MEMVKAGRERGGVREEGGGGGGVVDFFSIYVSLG